MRFDDRLMTVLEQPATDPHDRAVRWRQLVDLVARAGGQAGNPLVQDALELIRGDSPSIDEELRAAAARAIASLPLPFDLVAIFAADKLAIAAPVLAAARLRQDEWRQLRRVADKETARFIATLQPEQAQAADEPAETVAEDEAPAAEIPSISDVIDRIEKLRQSRTARAPAQPAAPAAPTSKALAADGPTLFRWESSPAGEISWIEGAPRGALIGRSIARAEEGEGVSEEVERAFALRAPFRDALFVIAGDAALAGEWKLSGVPAFEPADGRFRGYRGIALRDHHQNGNGHNGHSAGPADPNALRELVHEIKTPLNAIIGFAEIIDGQYLGPADRRYRIRAAEIVAQARLLLGAIDDLDFAAKLQADRGRPGSGTDLGMLLEGIAATLRREAGANQPRLDIALDTKRRRCALEPALAERLTSRFCSLLLDAATDRSQLLLHLDSAPGRCVLWVDWGRPFGDPDSDRSPLGFGLRLVGGLARIAGGDLVVGSGRISLQLPEL